MAVTKRCVEAKETYKTCLAVRTETNLSAPEREVKGPSITESRKKKPEGVKTVAHTGEWRYSPGPEGPVAPGRHARARVAA